jgi:hypothetical protein
VSGTLLAAFATPQARYTLTKADAGANLQDLAPRTFTSTTFAVGGTLQITVPEIGVLDIAHGGLLYSYPDYVAVGAKAHIQLGIFRFDGSLGGQLSTGPGTSRSTSAPRSACGASRSPAPAASASSAPRAWWPASTSGPYTPASG